MDQAKKSDTTAPDTRTWSWPIQIGRKFSAQRAGGSCDILKRSHQNRTLPDPPV
jgi:hypothetical protein